MPWTPAGQHDLFARFDEGEQRWFADGMFANAVHGARALLREVDFGAFRQLLDVGGNAGGYTVTLLGAHPGLRATIVDLEPVRKLAAERLTEAGLSSRACFVAGSFFEDCLPRGHDAALLSSIVHDWADEDCAASSPTSSPPSSPAAPSSSPSRCSRRIAPARSTRP